GARGGRRGCRRSVGLGVVGAWGCGAGVVPARRRASQHRSDAALHGADLMPEVLGVGSTLVDHATSAASQPYTRSVTVTTGDLAAGAAAGDRVGLVVRTLFPIAGAGVTVPGATLLRTETQQLDFGAIRAHLHVYIAPVSAFPMTVTASHFPSGIDRSQTLAVT